MFLPSITAKLAPSSHAPTRPPSLAEILGDPGYSDRAKRLAEYLDGCCRAPGRWVAWPKVSTIAAALGWDGTDFGGRKRVERGVRELAEGGALGRCNLRQLREWFDSGDAPEGLEWDGRLPRGLRQSLKVCVLLWRLPGPASGPPILPRCDTIVPSCPPPETAGVACRGTMVSQGVTTEVSHPSLNVRSPNEPTEETTTPRAREHAREGPTGPSSSSLSGVCQGEGEPEPPPDTAPARARLIEAIDRLEPPDSDGNRALRRFAGARVEEIRGETPTPHDHVRRALEIAAAAKLRPGKTIREHAAGTLGNWIREGFPPIEAHAPAGAGPPPDPDAERAAAVERRRAALAAEAEFRALRARWEGLPDPERRAIEAEVDRAHPELAGLPCGLAKVARRDLCIEALGRC